MCHVMMLITFYILLSTADSISTVRCVSLHWVVFQKIDMSSNYRTDIEEIRRGICYLLLITFPLYTVFKGTNGRQKTYEIFHVYCVFYSGFMCQTTVIFGITKDGSLVLTTLASWNCFTCRNIFQNGANDMSECLTCETAFCKKAQNYV